jgi:hypothetical protein
MPAFVFVLAAIAMILIFLLCMRVKLCIGYSGDFDFKVKYLFFTFSVKKQEKGKAKPKKEKPKTETKKPTIAQMRTFIDLFERFWGVAKETVVKIKKKMRIDKLKIDFLAGGDDAALTAITYGEACAVIFPAVSALGELVKVKKQQITVNANFNGAAYLDFECIASMRLSSILAIGIVSTAKILVSLIKNPISFKQRGVAK